MIEKLPFETKQTEYEGKILTAKTHTNPYDMQVKINELVDAVNALVKENNIHEKQIDELQMKMEPKKCEPVENTQDENPRCPFCGEELSYAQEIDGGFDILTCDCPHGIWLFGNDKMWYNLEKTTEKLERTRKALELAITGLKNCKTRDHIGAVCRTPEYVDKILEQITALEQKD